MKTVDLLFLSLRYDKIVSQTRNLQNNIDETILDVNAEQKGVIQYFGEEDVRQATLIFFIEQHTTIDVCAMFTFYHHSSPFFNQKIVDVFVKCRSVRT